ncbi:putative nucleotidyltransferase, ribonuclease H [Tanacetum coccineum]
MRVNIHDFAEDTLSPKGFIDWIVAVEEGIRMVAGIETDKGEGWKAKDHELAEDEEAKVGGGNTRPVSKAKGSSGLKCFNCGEPGHRQSECKKAVKRHLFADSEGDDDAAYEEYEEVPFYDEEPESVETVQKLGLKTENHPKPYKLRWLKKGGEVTVSKRVHVLFFVGNTYKDNVWCDVVPMDACHLLLDELEMGDDVFVLIGNEVAEDSKIPEAMIPLLEEFLDVFPDELPDGLPPLRDIQHHIDLEPGSQLPNRPHYRMSPREHEELCRFPIPRLDNLLEQISGATIFMKLDLKSGYYQICLRPGDEWETAFKTREGLYEWPFIGKSVVVYFDDILNYSASFNEYVTHVRQVLTLLWKDSFYAATKKCVLMTPKVLFLGYVVSGDAIQVDESKVAAVQEWPTPTTITEVQSFHGLASFYRRFILNFSSIMAHLTDCIKGKLFVWTKEAELAFQVVKEKLTTAPILILPDFFKVFELHTDASKVAISGVLSQGRRPVAYFSEKLIGTNSRYTTYNLEFYAVFQAVKYWRHYLFHKEFDLFTDHDSLRHIRTQDKASHKHGRWLAFLKKFTFVVKHKIGVSNRAAGEKPDFFLHDGFLFKRNQLCIPDSSLRLQIIKELHGEGHVGRDRTLQLVQASYFWPTMRKEVDLYVKRCRVCQVSKGTATNAGLYMPLHVPLQPWVDISMDFVLGLPHAVNVAQLFFRDVYRLHGLPSSIISDRDTRSLGNLLRCLVGDHVKAWDQKLCQAEFAHNHAVNRSYYDFVAGLYGVHKAVHENLVRVNSKYKQDADHKRRHVDFEEGDFVWAVLTKDRFHVREYNKLSAKKIGPLEIVEKINSNAYHLKLPSHIRCSDVFNVKHLIPYHGDSSDDDLAMNSRANFVYPGGMMEAQVLKNGLTCF